MFVGGVPVARSPFNVLVIPFHRSGSGETTYCVLRRSDGGYWQWIAGGGETGEMPDEAARREAAEEVGVAGWLYRLSSEARVPAIHFAALSPWPSDTYVIPEYAYAIELPSTGVMLSHEHSEARWVGYDDAFQLLHWQSNQTALWEMAERLLRADLQSE